MRLRNEGPIGIFDSGIAGLRVLDALAKRLPHEDFVYLGDTARHPYGTRGKQTIFNYCHACARALRDHRIKLLVLANHTASAVAQERLAAELFLPVVGALAPGLEAAVAAGATRIGVLTTTYLSRSGDHARTLAALGSQGQLYLQDSQLLCALTDHGEWEGELMELALRRQLAPLIEQDVQALVLGESPLSVLRAAAAHGGVSVFESTEGIVANVLKVVEAKQLATARTEPGKLRVVFSDVPADLRVAERFLGRSFAGITVTSVDL